MIQCTLVSKYMFKQSHDDVIKSKQLPRYWPYVRGIHRSAINSPHKGQWRGALMLSLISAWTNGWVNISRRRWFETPSRSLWRHCHAYIDRRAFLLMGYFLEIRKSGLPVPDYFQDDDCRGLFNMSTHQNMYSICKGNILDFLSLYLEYC